jgi:uncharacterized membrane protein
VFLFFFISFSLAHTDAAEANLVLDDTGNELDLAENEGVVNRHHRPLTSPALLKQIKAIRSNTQMHSFDVLLKKSKSWKPIEYFKKLDIITAFFYALHDSTSKIRWIKDDEYNNDDEDDHDADEEEEEGYFDDEIIKTKHQSSSSNLKAMKTNKMRNLKMKMKTRKMLKMKVKMSLTLRLRPAL